MTDCREKICTCDRCLARTSMLLHHPKFYEVRTLLAELADALDVDVRLHLVANHGHAPKTPVGARA